MKANKLLLAMPFIVTALTGCNNSIKLVSIYVDLQQSETVFMLEDMFVRPVVIATYSDKSAKNVSKDSEVTGFNLFKAGEQTIAVKYEDKETTYKINVCEDELDMLLSQLPKYQGHTNKQEFTIKRSVGYLTTGEDFLTIDLVDEGVTTRYKSGNSYVLDTVGTATYLEENGKPGDSSKYQTQIYDDQKNFYKITTYAEMDWADSYKKIDYTAEGVELNYDVGFSLSDITNVKQMKHMKNDPAFEIETTNFKCNILGGELHYGYSIKTYEIEAGFKQISSEISYDTKITIKNNEGVHMEQLYLYNEYYGGVKCQYVKAETSASFNSGEYEEFTGTKLKYVEVN